MRVFAAALTASLVIPLSTLAAQVLLPIEPGARVRVSALSDGIQNIVGAFSGYDGGNIAIKPDDEQNSLWIPLASVRTLHQVVGRKSNTVKGAWIGGLVAGTIGAVVGFAVSSLEDEQGVIDIGPGTAAVMCGGIGALLVGAPVGGFIGAFTITDRWEEVPLDRLRVSFAPQRDGRFALGLSVSF